MVEEVGEILSFVELSTSEIDPKVHTNVPDYLNVVASLLDPSQLNNTLFPAGYCTKLIEEM